VDVGWFLPMAHERMQGRRPRSEVQSAVIYNDQDESGRWIPLRLEIGSWVTLQLALTGPWARDARRHGGATNAGAWKAEIRRFRWRVDGRSMLHLDSIQVRHTYERRQLLLDPIVAANEPRTCNYLYASYWEDWVLPTSVLDVVLVLHHELGESTRNGRTHRELMMNGTFYLRSVYVPSSGVELYGSLEALPLPAISDPDWPIPDMHTSEAFRRKLAVDIAAAMKGSTGSSAAHVHWFMPVHVMADLFGCAATVRRTPTMYVFNAPSTDLLNSLMDPGWDEKHQIGQDILKCVVSRDSMIFRYHLARQTLYANFQYVRYKREGAQGWVPLDQTAVVEMITITVWLQGIGLPTFEVGRTWPVSHIRNEISILMCREDLHDDYDLVVERPGYPNLKVCMKLQLHENAGIWLLTSKISNIYMVHITLILTSFW
jgi:hypothetical protein